MALSAVTLRQPGQRVPPARTRQSGQSAPAALSARAGRAPRPRPRLRGPLILIFVVLGVLLSIAPASATPIGQDRFGQQSAAPQGWKGSRLEKLCPPGFHMEEASGGCTPCIDGVDYTNYSNALSACLRCRPCKSGEEEKSPCTSTKDTECHCKPGTFRKEDAPEFCYKCSARCPDGMVVAKPCSPFSDLKCVDQKSGNSLLYTGIGIAVGIGIVLLLALLCYKVKGCRVDPKWKDRVLFWRSHPLRGPEALDNAHNNMLSSRDSLTYLVPKQEVEERIKPTDVTAQSQGEAKCLLDPAGAEGSQKRRKLLVPANGADPTETLRLFFDDFATIVPCDLWDSLMRKLGLTQNEIHLVRQGVRVPRDALYEMLETWVSSKGRQASVNTLLDALETLGQRLAKERIQDHLLDSGKYIYEDGEAGSAVS